MDDQVIRVVMSQMSDVQAQHPGLQLELTPSDGLRLRGPVGFRIEYESRIVEDTYEIDIQIPDDFPSSPPTVYQIGDKIPPKFQHFFEAGNFCLGAPVEVRRKFSKHRHLQRFIDEQVIPYLFAYSYFRDYGRLPFGELGHGFVGLFEFYMDYFSTNLVETLKLLKLLADNFAPPASLCPCGSGSKLRECHGPRLDALRPHYPSYLFEAELLELIEIARQVAPSLNVRFPESSVIPKRIRKQRQRRRRRAKKWKRG